MYITCPFNFLRAGFNSNNISKLILELKSGKKIKFKNIDENSIPNLIEVLDKILWVMDNFEDSKIRGIQVSDGLFSIIREFMDFSDKNPNNPVKTEIKSDNYSLLFMVSNFNFHNRVMDSAILYNGNPNNSPEFQDFISKIISYTSDYLSSNIWDEFLTFEELKFYKILIQ